MSEPCILVVDDCIHLVIGDVRMPGVDGNEMARRMHAVRPAQRILIVTAFPGEIDDSVRRFESLGKPFNGEKLVAAVNSLLETGARTARAGTI